MPASETLPLAGPWRLALDRDDVGLREHWQQRPLDTPIELPGDLAQRGFGDPVAVDTAWIGSLFDRTYFDSPDYAPYRQPGNIKVPFWLQPELRYTGVAWYQREIEIPAAWAGRRVVVHLERPHWETRAWLDDRALGRNDSLSTPHEYDLGTAVAPGRHTLTVRVDNRYLVPIGPNSHSISDHTQGNWNGLVGRLELRATAPAWVDDLQVHPRVSSRSARVRGRVGGPAHLPTGARVRLTSSSGAAIEIGLDAEGRFEAEYHLRPDAALWNEFSPALHTLTATLPNGEARTITFGLREIARDGTQFTLNGRRIFLRGTLECAIFPLTGHPPTDVESWRRILKVARAHGLNHLRFHSWCPPEAAFIAGDEEGFYFQIEAASWPNQGAEIGGGHANDAWLISESERILRAYGNHPSFVLMASGNEPHGDNQSRWLAEWVEHLRTLDDRRLYTCSSAWPEIPASDYHVRSEPRIHQWGDHLKSRINAQPPETTTDYRAFIDARTVPVVSHEIGQWCVYPDFDEIARYTGYLKPRNFEIFRDSLAEHGMADQARAFLHASGKLQALCYKEEIESALRTPGMAGFQLLDLHDFPGQGTALVGVLNAFWEEKGYITAAEYHRFAGPTVPLARLARRVFTADETLEAGIEVTHFGATPLTGAQATWRLTTAAGTVVASGALPARDVPIGSAIALGRISVPLSGLPIPAPAACRLEVALPGPDAVNSWDVWIYPATVEPSVPSMLIQANALDDATLAALEAGATVFLSIPPDRVAPDPRRGKIALGFSSIFWNTAWTNQQAPHTLGILCDPAHPALAAFPTESHSNWQWWYPVMRAGAMILDDMPRDLRPIVQVIDDWFTNRRLALVFEARVGRGRLLVSSIDLVGASDPVCRQLHASLLTYAASESFRPEVEVQPAALRALTAQP
ncbi:MAG: glycoside hydrolase [Opitutaceae bacterium]|nr:glycoside hydrolase [Opitutaceae bacterium]